MTRTEIIIGWFTHTNDTSWVIAQNK